MIVPENYAVPIICHLKKHPSCLNMLHSSRSKLLSCQLDWTTAILYLLAFQLAWLSLCRWSDPHIKCKALTLAFTKVTKHAPFSIHSYNTCSLTPFTASDEVAAGGSFTRYKVTFQSLHPLCSYVVIELPTSTWSAETNTTAEDTCLSWAQHIILLLS